MVCVCVCVCEKFTIYANDEYGNWTAILCAFAVRCLTSMQLQMFFREKSDAEQQVDKITDEPDATHFLIHITSTLSSNGVYGAQHTNNFLAMRFYC